jgi:RNA polymerase subunit RPABC4/transcription elongation factor Spt4
MNETRASETTCPTCGSNAEAREWRIFAFLISALAIALAIEVLRLR